jgi:hypothetical protein
MKTDHELLTELLEELVHRGNTRLWDIFSAMHDSTVGRGRSLTPKQRAFAEATLAGDKYERPETYDNLVSGGTVPRGREVELLVRDKPLRPPGRRQA